VNLSVKRIISDCLKYALGWTEHSISHNIDGALSPNHQQNIDLIIFHKQFLIYIILFKITKKNKNIVIEDTNQIACKLTQCNYNIMLLLFASEVVT